ncbi:MAG TPA: hypothetical protein VGM90_16000 [Kofleriaceae bacterium]|jgi:hypothetical protein
MNVVPGASQQICAQAEACAHGDQRTALAMLLGSYIEMASRVVVSDQSSDRWLLAMSAYCQAAADKLRDAGQFYARGHRTSDDEQASYIGYLAGAQQAGETFAELLQHRFDSMGLGDATERMTDAYLDDEIAALDARS